jgi:hypothetical protein
MLSMMSKWKLTLYFTGCWCSKRDFCPLAQASPSPLIKYCNYINFTNQSRKLNSVFYNENVHLTNLGHLGLCDHRHKRIHRLLIGTACLPCFWLSSYAASHCLSVAPQSGTKQKNIFKICSLNKIRPQSPKEK